MAWFHDIFGLSRVTEQGIKLQTLHHLKKPLLTESHVNSEDHDVDSWGV